MIKARTLRWPLERSASHMLGICGEKCNHKIACKAKWEGDEMEDTMGRRCNDRRKAQRERERERPGDATWLALKVEEGTVHQEMEAEAEKGKETESPLEVPEK